MNNFEIQLSKPTPNRTAHYGLVLLQTDRFVRTTPNGALRSTEVNPTIRRDSSLMPLVPAEYREEHYPFT